MHLSCAYLREKYGRPKASNLIEVLNSLERSRHMSVTPSSTIVGIFTDRSMADQAMQAMYDAGFAAEQILYSTPGISGGILEDIKSLFTGTSPERSNLVNDLTGMGLSDEEAGYYANEYHNGKIILAVSAQGREQDAMDILNQYGAYNSQTQSGSYHETPNYPQQSSNYTQQSNYAPYETPPQQDMGRNWPAQPLSHTPEDSFEDHQRDRVTPEASTEDQTTQPVTSRDDSEPYSTQANIVTPGSDAGDQTSQTGTTAPEYSTNYQTAQSEAASSQTGTEEQTPQGSQAASESETGMQTPPPDVAAPEYSAENQSAQSEVAAPEPETDYQAQQTNAATSESETDDQ